MANRRSGCWRTLSTTRVAIALSLLSFVSEAYAITPGDPGPGDLSFSIDAGQNVRAISPYIYGMNSFFNVLPTGTYSGPAIALDRLGGNRWTGYNWETNYSNAGSDFNHVNDEYLVNYQGNTPPGEAVRPALVNGSTYDRAVMVTVPIAGYVSADHSGTVSVAQTAPSSRWNQVAAKKESVYPGSSLSMSPDETDDYAFTDEFVNWVKTTKDNLPNPPVVFYGLDNEPGLWDNTHPRLYGTTNPTFADLKAKTIAHASAIKDVDPDALVFGPTTFGWSDFRSLNGASDYTSSPPHPGNADFDFHEWYLNEIAQEEANQGRTLIDVLDMHWYPEATGGGTRITFNGVNDNSAAVVAARVQAPRSLWDPTYVESSWITGGCPECTMGQPIQFLDRVQADIDSFKPDTKVAITEYNYGGGSHISGAIAEADVLGIYGREGVFAATWWNIEGTTASAAPYTYGAFNMFRNFDGAGGTFGDTSVDAATDDIAASAVYASLDSSDPNRMVVVAINRTGSAQDAAIQLNYDRIFDHAEVYRLTSASPNPVQGADVELDLVNALLYSMPAYSVTTLVFVSDGLPGDYNGDGEVDAADYTVWRDSFGLTGDQVADGNEDNIVNEDDFLLWRENFGRTELGGGGGASAAAAVPEPATLSLAIWCALTLVLWRRLR